MFYDRTETGFPEWKDDKREEISGEAREVSPDEAPHSIPMDGIVSTYDRTIVDSVWEFAETVPGNDPELWRKDEFGEWIHRLDFGNRNSEFGWEIFDPGVGRHVQGVFALRPMQWQNYLRQYDVFG